MITNSGKRTGLIRLALEFVGRESAALVLYGVVLGVLISGVELAFAYALQAFLSSLGILQTAGITLPDWIPPVETGWVLSLVFVLGCVRAIVYWAQNYLQSGMFENFCYVQRSRVLHWAYFSKSVSSSKASVLFGQYSMLSGMALMSLQGTVIQLTSALFIAFSLFWMAPMSTFAAFAALSILLLPIRVLDRRTKVTSKKVYDEWEITSKRLFASIKNLLLIQIYGTQSQEEAYVTRTLKNYRDLSLLNARRSYLKSALPQVFGIAIVCLLSVSNEHFGELSGSALLSYLYLFLRMVQTLSGAAKSLSGISLNWAPLVNLFDWWSENRDKMSAGEAELGSDTGQEPNTAPVSWHVRNVSFRYPGGAPLFESMTVEIPAGSVSVLTGPSGSGKSTLLGILLGQLDPDEGEVIVRVGAEEIRGAQIAKLLPKCVGYVGPESFLIEGTVRENLMYGLDSTPSEDEIWRAIERSECKFIFDLSGRLEYTISEQGQGLSAGQKQRLGLARALLRKPRALVLDEATSNLDAATEEKLIELFNSFKGELTIIAVTHRPAMLSIADQVISFD